MSPRQPPRAQAQQDRRDDEAPPWAVGLIDEIGEMRGDHALMKERLGRRSDDGKGGTGLIGDMVEMKAQMASLMSLKTLGVGAFGGIILVVGLVMFGVKGVLGAIFGFFGVKP